MYERDKQRIASSELNNPLFGDITKYGNILRAQKENLQKKYPDPILRSTLDGLDSRIISVAPMVLFDTMLKDMGLESNEKLLAGLGLIMYSVSSHDDVVDERPTQRLDVAGLIYAGDITTLEGMRLLVDANSPKVISVIIDYMNLTNLAQTKIVENLWDRQSNEETYLDSINTTRYWAEVGLQAAITYAGRPDLHDFVDKFSILYGKTCQLFDDVREIDDDVKNGYNSLPINLAHEHNWDLNTPDGKNRSIGRSKEIASNYIQQAKDLCGNNFPNLEKLVDRLSTGLSISY